ncbi:MAG: glycosyltransferase [Anaerolineales bacterium]
MRITINTFGTRGDVQPYLALGIELKNRGHQVKLLTHQIFEGFAQQYGITVHPLDLDPKQILLQQSLADIGGGNWRITRWLVENFQWVLDDLFRATLDAAREADLIINSGISLAGWHVAEKLDLPAIAAYLWPVTPTRELPGVNAKPLPGWIPCQGIYNRISTKAFNQFFFYLLSPLINTCRAEILGLPPLSMGDYWPLDNPRTHTPLLYGFSQAVIPKPAEWTGWQQITGYWWLPPAEPYQPPLELESFLAAGPKPISIGFGSMVDHERDTITQMVVEALKLSGQRGVLLGGWSELGEGILPEQVIRLESVPHDWLFPRTAGVVHHGGAGTTAAGLRAGVPAVVIPNFADQFFWGNRIQQLRAGPKPIPRQHLSVEKLAGAIQSILKDPGYQNRAAQLGDTIRAEMGVMRAVDLVERFGEEGIFP